MNHSYLLRLSWIPLVAPGLAQDVVFSIPSPAPAHSSIVDSARAGDVNADGTQDLILGYGWAPGYTAGFVQVFSGVDGALLHEIEGPHEGSMFGTSVAAAGDLDGDGHGDFLVGAPGANPNGRAYVYSGQTGQLLHNIPTCPLCTGLGQDVASIGDLDGDGFDDFVVGHLRSEIDTFVYSGATGLPIFGLPGAANNGFSGAALDASFDFDGDGLRDVVMGAPRDSVAGVDAGRVRVVSTGTGAELVSVNGNTQDWFGTRVAATSDISGDGVPDLAASTGLTGDGGRVMVLSGADGSTLWEIAGPSMDSRVGLDLDWIGDHDGDGFPDLLTSSRSSQFLDDQGRVEIRSGVDGALLNFWYGLEPYTDLGVTLTHLDDGVFSVTTTFLRTREYLAVPAGRNYCQSTPNSTGAAAQLRAVADRDVASNDLQLIATPVPDDSGLFYYGPLQSQVPFGNGFRCIGGALFRLPIAQAVDGVLWTRVDLDAPPSALGLITPGSTWNFQAWFRDPAGGGSFFDLSDAMEIQFQP